MTPEDFREPQRAHLTPIIVREPRIEGGVVGSGEARGWAFVPPELPPVLDWERVLGRLWGPLTEATAALARLEGIDATQPVLRPIWIREVQASSQIEGTVATIEEVALAASGRTFESDAPLEVFNNLRALEHGIRSPKPFSRELIREMHAILFEGLREGRGGWERPGAFREGAAYIGDPRRGFAGARFVPAPPERIEGLLADLERYVNREDRHTPALVRVALAHYQFEAIHPFRDGNGRLGRLLVARSICKEGLLSRPLVSISSYIERHRAGYYGGLLRVSTEGDWEGWLEFFLRAVADQAADVERRSARLRQLRDDMVERVASRREPSDAMVRLIDSLFEQPALSVNGAAERLGLAATTVRRNVERLVDEGVLVEATEGKYDRRYVAPAVIRLAEEELG